MFKAFKEYKLLPLAITLLLVGVFGLLIVGVMNNSKKGITEPLPEAKVITGEVDIRNAFISAAKTVGPAVVSISTERTRKVGIRRFPMRPETSPFQDEFFKDFFKEFFKDFPEREYKQSGMGSGVIIDKEGYILTNEHVINGADKITVVLPDGREFNATVKGADSRSDLAVIKIDANNLPVAELGNSSLMQIGEWVVAIGNPFGFVMRSPEPTVTAGVVSALHRSLPRKLPGYTDLIQTDAAINPGNSGGPLCDLDGKVIGINVAIFSQTGGYQGVGFAIPINYAKDILKDLLEGKQILYGWLGVSVQELTKSLADYFGIDSQEGVLVAGVVEDGPAKKAGVVQGDVIKNFNGKKIKDVNELLRAINRTKVGDLVKLDLIRDKEELNLTVTIGERPTDIDKTVLGGEESGENLESSWRGARVTAITDEIASKLGFKDKTGVVVINLERGSSAFEAGLIRGDLIKEIDRRKIEDLESFVKIVETLKGDVLVQTERGYLIVKEK